jgi:hypothetical protein
MEELGGCFAGEEVAGVGWKNACIELSLCEFSMVSPSALSGMFVLSMSICDGAMVNGGKRCEMLWNCYFRGRHEHRSCL